MGISLECSSCPGLAGVLNIDNDPGRYADGGNQTCYNSGSAGHCSLPWSESQGQAPAQSRGFSSAGLSFQGNPHLLTALAFLLPFRLAQVCVCVCVLEVGPCGLARVCEGSSAPSMALQCILKKLFVKLLNRWIGGCEAGHHEIAICLLLRFLVFPLKISTQKRSHVWGVL